LAALVLFFSFLEERKRLSNSGSSKSAGATFDFRNAIGIFANQFAFRLGTVGFVTFPIAFGFFAYGFTFGFGSLAMSYAMRLFANSNTLRAIKHFTSFIGTFNFAFWFFAFNIANCVFRFSARSVAFRRFANRIANSWAVGIIAFPGALRMALFKLLNY
jgi:hypothetical protein